MSRGQRGVPLRQHRKVYGPPRAYEPPQNTIHRQPRSRRPRNTPSATSGEITHLPPLWFPPSMPRCVARMTYIVFYQRPCQFRHHGRPQVLSDLAIHEPAGVSRRSLERPRPRWRLKRRPHLGALRQFLKPSLPGLPRPIHVPSFIDRL